MPADVVTPEYQFLYDGKDLFGAYNDAIINALDKIVYRTPADFDAIFAEFDKIINGENSSLEDLNDLLEPGMYVMLQHLDMFRKFLIEKLIAIKEEYKSNSSREEYLARNAELIKAKEVVKPTNSEIIKFNPIAPQFPNAEQLNFMKEYNISLTIAKDEFDLIYEIYSVLAGLDLLISNVYTGNTEALVGRIFALYAKLSLVCPIKRDTDNRLASIIPLYDKDSLEKAKSFLGMLAIALGDLTIVFLTTKFKRCLREYFIENYISLRYIKPLVAGEAVTLKYVECAYMLEKIRSQQIIEQNNGIHTSIATELAAKNIDIELNLPRLLSVNISEYYARLCVNTNATYRARLRSAFITELSALLILLLEIAGPYQLSLEDLAGLNQKTLRFITTGMIKLDNETKKHAAIRVFKYTVVTNEIPPIYLLALQSDTLKYILTKFETIAKCCRSSFTVKYDEELKSYSYTNITPTQLFSLPAEQIELIFSNDYYIYRMAVLINYHFMTPDELLNADLPTKRKLLQTPALALQCFNPESTELDPAKFAAAIETLSRRISEQILKTKTANVDLDLTTKYYHELLNNLRYTVDEFKACGLSFEQCRIFFDCMHFELSESIYTFISSFCNPGLDIIDCQSYTRNINICFAPEQAAKIYQLVDQCKQIFWQSHTKALDLDIVIKKYFPNIYGLVKYIRAVENNQPNKTTGDSTVTVQNLAQQIGIVSGERLIEILNLAKIKVKSKEDVISYQDLSKILNDQLSKLSKQLHDIYNVDDTHVAHKHLYLLLFLTQSGIGKHNGNESDLFEWQSVVRNWPQKIATETLDGSTNLLTYPQTIDDHGSEITVARAYNKLFARIVNLKLFVMPTRSDLNHDFVNNAKFFASDELIFDLMFASDHNVGEQFLPAFARMQENTSPALRTCMGVSNYNCALNAASDRAQIVIEQLKRRAAPRLLAFLRKHGFITQSSMFSIDQNITKSALNSKNIAGNTPLHQAIIENEDEICLALLAHDVKLCIKNIHGFTAEQTAIQYQRFNIVIDIRAKLDFESANNDAVLNSISGLLRL
jgi:hypothetical protein